MPVALGVNGGILGSNNLPSSGSAKGIWTPNEIARAVGLGFWPLVYARTVTETSSGADNISTGSTDPFFEYTTLLLPGNGTNGAQNNTFLDSSSNNFTITRNPTAGPNAPTQGTFSPFSQTGWGNRFNFATPDALRPSATTISNFGTGAFTVEFWINFQNTNNAGIYYGGNGGGSVFLDYYSGSLRWGISGGAIPISYAFTPTIGRWYHVAFTRSSTTDTLYIDGTSVATGPDSQNYPSDSSPYVGSWNGSIYNGTAFISNFRIVKGVTVYTGAFTPPTSPLTATQSAGTNIAAITTGQTSLLTCQSNRFVDNGQGNTGNTGFTITVNGSPSVQAFSPFNPSASWSAATYGGSGYFDGNGDYLQGPVNSAFAFGTGEYCMEGWIYMTSAPASPSGLIDLRRAAPNYNAPWLNVTSGYKLALRDGTLGADVVIGATNIQLNTWTHVAVTRQVTSNAGTRIFLNGVLDANSITNNSNYSNGALTLATAGDSLGSFMFTGYMSDVRITKGSVPTSYQTSATTSGTAVFTPPTSPETTTSQGASSPSILLNFTNAGIYDATSKNDLETVGDAQISTTQSKWGGSSIYLDGTGDWLTNNNASNSLLAFGTGDFTIEGWFYSNNASSAVQRGMFQTSDTIGGLKPNYTTGVAMHHGATAGELSVYVGSTTYSTSGASITTGAWFYFAITRSSGNVNVYVNGVSRASGSGNTNNLTGTYISVGGYYSTSYLFDGYLQDFRITKGYARTITASPTAAFPTL